MRWQSSLDGANNLPASERSMQNTNMRARCWQGYKLQTKDSKAERRVSVAACSNLHIAAQATVTVHRADLQSIVTCGISWLSIMQFHPAADAPHIAEFANRSLVLPGEAVGNVGQLAVDLLIVRHSLTCIGYLETPLIQPCAGLNAYDGNGKVHLAMELYAAAGTGVVMLQQRAPVLRGCQAQFAAQLAEWLHSSGFSQVIYLCSLNARVRTDAQITGPQQRCIAASHAMRQLGSSMGISELEDSIVQTARSALLPPWALVAAAEERSLPLLAVITFATEGDNVLDAEQLAGAVDKHVTNSAAAGSSAIEWQRPISWQSVYGARDLTIY